MFNEIQILDHDGAIDLINRDICGFADINKMLTAKYDNDNFYASKIMWYDEEIPEELIKEPETSSLEERRV